MFQNDTPATLNLLVTQNVNGHPAFLSLSIFYLPKISIIRNLSSKNLLIGRLLYYPSDDYKD
jgi:hypothetical protein